MPEQTLDLDAIAKKSGLTTVEGHAASGPDFSALARKSGLTEVGASPSMSAAPKPAAKAPENRFISESKTDLTKGMPSQERASFSAAPKPSAWKRAKMAFGETETGRTVENNAADLSRMYRNAKEKLSNPYGATDAEWAEHQKNEQAFFDKHLSQMVSKIDPNSKGAKWKIGAAQAAVGGAQGAVQFGEDMLSPGQLMLLASTMGESALAQGGRALLGDAGVPIARTLSKLVQAHFIAQMVEGAATGVEETAKSAWRGDWQNAGRAAIDALASGVMAKGLISHEEAQVKVQGDLDRVARQKYGEPEGSTLGGVFKSRFDQLNPYQQGAVIDEAVRTSPEYQEVLKTAEDSDKQAEERTKKQHARKLNDYYGAAVEQSYDPNVARRTIRGLQKGRERGARMELEGKRRQFVDDALKAARDQYEKQRNEAKEAARQARPQARQEAAEQRSEVGRVASSIAESREQAWTQRNEAREVQQATEGPRREVESAVDAQGNVTYPAMYWGEPNTFGVAADLTGHAIYRQTPRGVEWLDSNGNFSETPDSLYSSVDPAAADTMARLYSLQATADTVADEEGATPEQQKEAEDISAIRRDLVSGEIDAREAQRRAGIAEKTTLPDEYTAARDGRLNGPFYESNAGDYYESLRKEAQDAGWSEEETNAALEESGLLARQQTEQNLHHVYRPGDYVISKRGIRWTLDSKGMLHPDDGGQPVPLMKRGLYSNDAVQLAQSGRIGYGTRTREERRADDRKRRETVADIQKNQEAVDREMRLAVQREGLELAAEAEPRGDIEQKRSRESRLMSRPPRRPESQVDQIVRMIFKAPTDAASVIHAIANRQGVSDEEVMRLQLAGDPERSTTPEAKVARLELGDSVADPFRPDKPWKVEQGKDGKLYLRSGNAAPLPLDRLNPSERVKQLVAKGEVTTDRPEFTEADANRAAFEVPHYIRDEDRAVEAVKERSEKKVVDPKPVNEVQAKTQAQAAERRSEAVQAVATRAVVEALSPPPDTTVEAAEETAVKANEQIKVAEQGYAQEAEAKSKTIPEDVFPQRAPATIGYRSPKTETMTQNSRDFPFHYELLPLDSLVTSHIWRDGKLEINEDYPRELQPRTISEAQSKDAAMRGEVRRQGSDGKWIGYNFREYADRTINGSMGPAIVDDGGRVVGGNRRLSIMRKHLQNLESIPDAETREAYMLGFQGAMRKLAEESGIASYPDDGTNYAVVRMLDDPIKTTREAADLGRLFNKSVSEQITKSALGVSYAKSLTEPILEDIGRRVDVNDGIAAAIQADPEYFTNLVRDQFGVDPEENTNWFAEKEDGSKVLHEEGRSQLVKVLLGTVIKDTALLNRLEGKTPYRALERSLGHILKMRALPDRDITGKITEALQAAAETLTTDPSLSVSNDKWLATYHPDQIQLAGMETEAPSEPDRVTEALWRALHTSDAGSPRVFNDRLKAFIGEESSMAMSMFEPEDATPADAFNRAFSRELTEVQHSRGDKEKGISQQEFEQALNNREMSDVEREEAQETEQATKDGESAKAAKPEVEKPAVEAKPPTGKMERPPKPPTKEDTAVRNLSETKQENGYVTPAKLKEFLETNPATKDSATELIRTARLMSEYVYDTDPPIGVDRKDALDWVLKERLAGIESGDLKTKRGQYSDPNVEKNFGDSIMKLHKAADASTFIHEFAHVIFPLLSDEDMKAIDTIEGKSGKRVWDGTRKGMEGRTYTDLSEKLANGLEQFLRDENPTGFTAEVKALLAKVKDIMRRVYLKFAGDPLSEYVNSEKSREVFAKMFGIKDFDVADDYMRELKKARAEEKRMKKPSEEPHPLVKAATEAGADGIRNTFAGKVEDSVGTRVDPKKPVAVFVFANEAKAAPFWTSVVGEGSKVDNAELIAGDDGSYGVRFNTKAKVPPDVLYQDVPKRHPGLELEDAKKRLAGTPESAPMIRKLLETKIRNLENEIRAKYGADTEPVANERETAKEALKEVKNGTDTVRKATDGVSGLHVPRKFNEVPKPPTAKPANAAAGGSRLAGRPVRVPVSLADVTPVTLQPLPNQRGVAVGTVKGEAFDVKAWVEGLKSAGLPETLPPPTWALDRKTADKLIFPGQKQIVQTALSALEQGDAVVVASATGTGKTYTGAAIAKEYRSQNPDAKILFITKNAGLLKSAQGVALNTFGFEVENEIPDADAPTGNYGATYARIIRSDAFKNTKWDLVIADESGEARNWFKDENKQGKALMDITANAKKVAYFSATPFHSPMEYGYLNKMNLWPKGGFDRWIENNFAHEKIDDKIVAKLDPGKQAKLRQQLIERGQLVSQAISYDGFTAHFGVVPVTDSMKRGLDRIHEGFARARQQLVEMKKKGLAEKVSAFEATYTKAFLERERLPQAIELAKKARANGWQVILFSETSSEDLFRRDTTDPGTYQQLDEAMGGQLSKIIPPFGDVYQTLRAQFGEQIGDYSGRGNSMAERERAKGDFLSGETPMLYTTFAAGGIGVSLHDADYPERGIKGGDKPRVAIFLGPPYSGVLLEQSMGRTWRFGVKSDTHAVFLATDSEPDVRLMQQKVGPRMRALRASVLGERDSLASAMASYTDDEKIRARQESLAYQEGNEEKLTASSFQVRSKSRNVGIDDWSQINFPPADSAKNKGMKYGEDVSGGDWSTLYQNREKAWMGAPESAEVATGKSSVEAISNGLATGQGLPPDVSVQNLEPADRDVVVGAASAVAADAVEMPVERDTRAVARQAMQSQMNLPGNKDKWVLTFDKKGKVGVWKYTGDPEDITRTEGPEREPRAKDIRSWYGGGLWTQEMGVKSIARQAGRADAGDNIVRMNRSYQADSDTHFADYAMDAHDIMRDAKLDEHDPRVMAELWDVVEGKRTTDNPQIQKAADSIAGLHQRVKNGLSKADVKLKTPSGEMMSFKDIEYDRNYMPHRIDWDAKVEDPQTGEVHILKDVMKETFSEASRRRIIEAIAQQRDYTYDQVMSYLKAYAPNTPVLGHIHRARTLDFPFIKKDWKTLMGYYKQAADAIAIEKNFGHDRKKLEAEISRIPSENGRKTITSMFDGLLEPQEWSDWTAKVYNAAIAYEAASKMTISIAKLPYHAIHIPMGMKGRIRPFATAALHLLVHPKEVYENASYVGTIARQLNAADVIAAEDSQGITHQIFGKTGFNAAYKMVRAVAGESARVWMEQYAMHELRKGNPAEARRLLRDVMLIGDHGIDQAIANGKFTPEDLAKGQTAFANMVAWSNNPLQMPGWARLHIERNENTTTVGLKRAVRLTYALQSFSLKSMSLLREHLWDEVMVHHNLKPLAYFLVVAPVAGQMLQGTTAATKGFVHRGLEGAIGKKHTEDSWDKYLAQMEAEGKNPSAVKALKFYIDSVTLGYGMDMLRIVSDPIMDLASGQGKKALKEFEYVPEDILSHLAGPVLTDLWKTLVTLPTQIGKIESGTKHQLQKGKKVEKALKEYVAGQVPILRQVPGFLEPPKRK